jgi:hypothetical protein
MKKSLSGLGTFDKPVTADKQSRTDELVLLTVRMPFSERKEINRLANEADITVKELFYRALELYKQSLGQRTR